MGTYEFFKKEFEIRGKHARMAGELCQQSGNGHTYFKRLIDLYIAAAVIGFRADRKAEEDYSPGNPKCIFPEQLTREKETLDFILQLMIVLEGKENVSAQEAVNKAFCGAQTKEEFDDYQKMFHAYVRGGIEELYERLILPKADGEDAFYDNKTANLMAQLKRFISLPGK